MKIGQVYSHLNGLEFLLVHKRDLWEEIQNAVWNVDAGKAFDNTSRKKTMVGRCRYSPSRLNVLFQQEFSYHGWHEMRTPYFVNEDLQTTKETVDIRDKELQRQAIISRGFQPYGTYNQVDFVKERVAVEVQFGKYFSVQYDLHVKHTFFYGRGDMDVGVEIIPICTA